MRPPSAILSNNCLVTENVPITLISMILRKISSVRSDGSAMGVIYSKPALLISTSTCLTCACIWSICDRSAMSQEIPKTCRSYRALSCSATSATSSSNATIVTVAPASKKPSASPNPMPRLAPVINTCLAVRSTFKLASLNSLVIFRTDYL